MLFASSKYAGLAVCETQVRFSNNVFVLITRRSDDVGQFFVRIKMWRSVFWVALNTSILKGFGTLLFGELTPVVHIVGRLKAGLRTLNYRRHDLADASLEFAVVGDGRADGDLGGVDR